MTVYPFQGRELDGFESSPRPAPMDHLGLVEPVDGFGERIVNAETQYLERVDVLRLALTPDICGRHFAFFAAIQVRAP